jgi:hypothetical protein
MLNVLEMISVLARMQKLDNILRLDDFINEHEPEEGK